MVSSSLTALAAFAGLAAAGPVKLNKRGGFSVQQVAVPRAGAPLHPAEHVARAYHKFGNGDKVPTKVAKVAKKAAAARAAAADPTGDVTATPAQGDVEYLCPVSVGAETLTLDFDTGSSDLWVMSDLMSSPPSGHGIYKTAGGKVDQGSTWSISYGDGSTASGNVYTDNVVIGGVSSPNQAVEAASTVAQQFLSSAGDGLVGLAFSSINTVKPQPVKTFFDSVADSLQSKLFTATLKHAAPGSYDFGFIDDSKHSGEIFYTDVDNSQGFWQFTPSGYSVGQTAGTGSIPNGIADTGTTLLLLPDDVAAEYWKGVQGSTLDQSAGGYTFPCDAQLPDFTVQMSSGSITVPGSLINLGSADSSSGSSTASMRRRQDFGGDDSGDDFGSLFGGDDGGDDEPTATGTDSFPTATATDSEPTATDSEPTATATDSEPTATATDSAPTGTDSVPTATGTDSAPTSAPTGGSGSGASGTCFGGLGPIGQIGSGGGPAAIFGDVFLKAAFVVFDNSQSTPRLGFAPQK